MHLKLGKLFFLINLIQLLNNTVCYFYLLSFLCPFRTLKKHHICYHFLMFYHLDEKMETIQNNLYSFIQDCNEILRTGALIYGKNVNAAELVWQVTFISPIFFPCPLLSSLWFAHPFSIYLLYLSFYLGSFNLGKTRVFNKCKTQN